MGLDGRVQRRLRERRLVAFVVAVPTVPHEIDEEILPELRAIRDAKSHRRDARLDVVRVHVDDRDLEALREIARVVCGPRVRRIGREADLVVDDDVQRAPDRISAEP